MLSANQVELVCEQCGKVFVVYISTFLHNACRYCCPRCARLAKTRPWIITRCETCGREIKSREEGRRFCCVACRTPFLKTGGVIVAQGYIYILNHEHHLANSKGYVKRSYLIMEQKLGRLLRREEIVHHVNEVRSDDRPENLQLFASAAEHTHFHHLKKRPPRI